MKATAKDLRFHSKEILETVSRGEEVVVTYRGKPHAKIIPMESSVNTDSRRKLFGMWQDHKLVENVDEYIRNLRRSRYDLG